MPINRQDAQDVDQYVSRFFGAEGEGRVQALRLLFVEKLDFASASGVISLANASKNVTLPPQAERIASMEGLHVVYVPLNAPGSDRVRKAEAAAAAKLVADALHGDMLLVMTNPSGSQLHVIYPIFAGAAPSLRRMIIERDLPRRTAVQQLSEVYHEWKRTGSIGHAVERAFDVEAVTKQFFEEYRRVFDSVMAAVKGFGQGEEEAEAKKLFVQTLFNRLMFIYFISRKGWLTFDRDKDYLNALWRAHQARPDENKNFYADRLRLLFFAGLNNHKSQDLTSEPEAHRLLGVVPFLNGGLFDRTDEDNRTRVVVPDDSIQEILRQLFDRFNFTVMESTPFDVEVAVDPEMLGKVFEELVTGRHESGSYYTPRPVVSFMCREALKGYLETQNTGASADAIAAFVDHKDTGRLNLSTAPRIGEALARVKVVDPACGSGAYLLGMMQELVELMTTLYSSQLSRQSQDLYDLKLHIIEQNLYGADIDQFAVNIAMLRLWLSLAIEYDGYPPPSLPNLDFKIVRGDSLTAPDPNPSVHGAQYQMFREQAHAASARLATLKQQHMNAVDSDKRLLAEKIQKEQANLSALLAFAPAPKEAVDWRVTFAEVFDQNGGFDIAIANPPYRRQEGLSTKKDDLKRLYPAVYASTADYHVYFYNRSAQLLRDGGELSFITSNKYMRAAYGENIRAFLPATLTIGRVIDFGDLPVFKAAAYPAIVVGRKETPSDGHAALVADLAVPVRRDLLGQGKAVTVEAVSRAMERLPEFLDAYGVRGYPQVLLKKDGWILEDPKLVALFNRLMSQGTPLGEFVKGRMYRGVLTGLNEAFVINEAKRQELIEADPRSAEVIKPWLRGQDIKKWRSEWAGLYLIAVQNSGDADARNPWGRASAEKEARRIFKETYPAIHDHLSQYEEYEVVDKQGRKKRVGLRIRDDHGKWWWELRACKYYKEFAQPKILWPENTSPDKLGFSYSKEAVFVNNKGYLLPEAPVWLLAILNSSLMHFLASEKCTRLRGGWLEMRSDYVVSKLPVHKPDASIKNRLPQIANLSIEQGTDANSSMLDELVSKLYGVTSHELSMLVEWKSRQSSLPAVVDEQEEE